MQSTRTLVSAHVKITQKIFKLMFPDSAIANQFVCAESKSLYLALHGIAPYFLQKLKESVKSAGGEYVLLFDDNRQVGHPIVQGPGWGQVSH